MGVNQLYYGNQLKLNLANDTVTADKVVSGLTLHLANGNPATGTMLDYTAFDLYCQKVEIGSTTLTAHSYVLPLPAVDLGGREIKHLHVYSNGLSLETASTTGNYTTSSYIADVLYSRDALLQNNRKYIVHSMVVRKTANVAGGQLYLWSASRDGYYIEFNNLNLLSSGGASITAITTNDDIGRFRSGVTYYVVIGG